MKMLVTGGSSRLGGYVLRELLEHSHTLSNFGRTAPYVPGLTHVARDIGDRAAVRGHEG
jgi:nucleoside-diphosphate-sugar epimerase